MDLSSLPQLPTFRPRNPSESVKAYIQERHEYMQGWLQANWPRPLPDSSSPQPPSPLQEAGTVAKPVASKPSQPKA